MVEGVWVGDKNPAHDYMGTFSFRIEHANPSIQGNDAGRTFWDEDFFLSLRYVELKHKLRRFFLLEKNDVEDHPLKNLTELSPEGFGR